MSEGTPYRTKLVSFPKDKKKRKILHNRIKCRTCNTLLESHHVHDFVGCSCPEESRVYADGGKDYLRRLGDPSNYEDLSTYEEE